VRVRDCGLDGLICVWVRWVVYPKNYRHWHII
jgi:hypothetical protein